MHHEQVTDDIRCVQIYRLITRNVEQDSQPKDQCHDQVQRPDPSHSVEQEIHVTRAAQMLHHPVMIAIGNDKAAQDEEEIDGQIGPRKKRDGELRKGRLVWDVIKQDGNGRDPAQAGE